MIKINCTTCSYIEYTAEDGIRCNFKDVYYLDEIINTEIEFCKNYSYDYCIECFYKEIDELEIDCENCLNK